VQGSHHIYGKLGSVIRLSIPIHGNKPLKTGLLHHLMKLSEMPESELR
jgi:predicted RNA binding protein YcfA (HicA-like mRNA interferase family)